MPIGAHVFVPTPDVEKYHNDVLHPCIRRMSDGRYVMVHTPWYRLRDSIENPILYISDDPYHWDNGIVVEDTPTYGYNSDPNVYEENGRIYVFWREFETPFCDSLRVKCATVGVYSDDDGQSFSNKKVYLTRTDPKVDSEICPILMKKGDKYFFYASWYQTIEEDRHNLGVAIWEGTSLESPDFKLTKQIPFKTKYICDKYKQYKFRGNYVFIPCPHKFDLWHFDLFEYDDKLFMVASEEMDDNIVLLVAPDYQNFELVRTPLLNGWASLNSNGYKQWYYKPTAFMQGDTLHLFYTTNENLSYFHNQLYHTSAQINGILK